MARQVGGSFLLLAICAIGALAHAEPAVPIAFGKSVAPLNGPWEFQIGDSPVDPQTGKIVNGKLYLNNNQRALDIFNKDPSGTITKAESKWPTVKDKAL